MKTVTKTVSSWFSRWKALGLRERPRLLQRKAGAGVATAKHTHGEDEMRIENAVVIIWDEVGEEASTFLEAADGTGLVLDRDLTTEELNNNIELKLFGKDTSSWRATGIMEINDVTIITSASDRGHRSTVQIIWLGAAE